MKRDNLAWALRSVIPHAGSSLHGTDYVGMACRQGVSYLFAGDNYTTGMARLSMPAPLDLYLPLTEAVALERFIRASNNAQRAETLAYDIRPGELHIGTDQEAAIFETVTPGVAGMTYERFVTASRSLYEKPVEFDECIYLPDFVDRFRKAKRAAADRLRIFPRHAQDKYGAAVVTVGTDFIGAIAGLTYDQLGPATVAGFLYDNEREVAA